MLYLYIWQSALARLDAYKEPLLRDCFTDTFGSTTLLGHCFTNSAHPLSAYRAFSSSFFFGLVSHNVVRVRFFFGGYMHSAACNVVKQQSSKAVMPPQQMNANAKRVACEQESIMRTRI